MYFVYEHFDNNGKKFYIGKGKCTISKDGTTLYKRAFNKSGRSREWKNGNGYKIVSITEKTEIKSTLKNLYVHRLVAEAFIPNPENKSEIHHIDSNRSNNNISNLEWCTREENIDYISTGNSRKLKRRTI